MNVRKIHGEVAVFNHGHIWGIRDTDCWRIVKGNNEAEAIQNLVDEKFLPSNQYRGLIKWAENAVLC